MTVFDKTKRQLLEEIRVLRLENAKLARKSNKIHGSEDVPSESNAEEALRIERDKLQALMDGITRAGIGIDIVGIDHRILFQNETLEQRFGDIRGEPCYKHYMTQEDPCDRCPVVEAIQQNAAVEVEQKGLDGRDYQIFTAPLPESDGSVNKAIEIVLDISERKKAEEALREQQEKAQKYLDVAGVMFVVLDANGIVTLVNKKGCELLGYKEEEIVGKNWFQNILPDKIKDDVNLVFNKLIAEEIEPVEYFENTVLTKDGEERLIAWHNTILRDNLGNITGTLSSGLDITERRQAEEAMKKSSIIIDTTTDAVISTDIAGNITFWNKGAEIIYGYRKEEIIGKPISIIYKDQDLHVLEAMIADLMEGKNIPGLEVTCIDKNRQDVEILLSLTTIKDEDGNVTELVGITKDVTERKRAEAERQRLTAILEATSDFVSTSTPDGQITYINRAGKEMISLTEDDVSSSIRIADVHPDWALRIVEKEGVPAALERGGCGSAALGNIVF